MEEVIHAHFPSLDESIVTYFSSMISESEDIGDNFENIVTAIQTSGINIFIKPETNKHKNC